MDQQFLEEFAAILDFIPRAVVMLDASSNVVWANRSGKEVLNECDGLTIDRDGIRAATPAQNTRLRQLIYDAATATSEGALSIDRPSGRRPLSMLVCSSKRSGNRAVAFIGDPEKELKASEEMLGRIFGLTRAESRLAALLMLGRNLKDCCRELGLSRNTAHSQLKKIFEKTHTNRQSELVRLLISSPAGLRKN